MRAAHRSSMQDVNVQDIKNPNVKKYEFAEFDAPKAQRGHTIKE